MQEGADKRLVPSAEAEAEASAARAPAVAVAVAVAAQPLNLSRREANPKHTFVETLERGTLRTWGAEGE